MILFLMYFSPSQNIKCTRDGNFIPKTAKRPNRSISVMLPTDHNLIGYRCVGYRPKLVADAVYNFYYVGRNRSTDHNLNYTIFIKKILVLKSLKS